VGENGGQSDEACLSIDFSRLHRRDLVAAEGLAYQVEPA
jgi:hypothetical protein